MSIFKQLFPTTECLGDEILHHALWGKMLRCFSVHQGFEGKYLCTGCNGEKKKIIGRIMFSVSGSKYHAVTF